MSIRNNPHLIDIEIVRYSKKGNGIGYFLRQDNTEWPVEVAFTIPGDVVKVQLLRKKSGLYQSQFIELLTPSPDRITPRCIHFGVCGGCRWQQISYQEQLKLKDGIIKKCFETFFHDDREIKSIIPSVKEWHYRNKMEFSFSSDAKKSTYLGLIMNASKGKVFELTECHLPNSWYAETLNIVRTWWKDSHLDAYHASSNTGSLRTITFREGQRSGDRMINLTVSGNPDFALHKPQMDSFVAAMKKVAEPDHSRGKLSLFLTIQQAIRGQPTRLYEMHLYGPDHIKETLHIQPSKNTDPIPLVFHISPKAFFQPNPSQAEVLYSTALQLANIPKNAVVYDLYCGTGTMGICIATTAKQVIGIELSPDSAHDARHNAAFNGLNNVTILTGAVEEKLAEIQKEKLFPPPDVVLVDPPRPGLDADAIKHIIELSPTKIVYISCNPSTQAQNMVSFLNAGYQIQTIQPVDQFPHTVHIENIVILTR